MSIDKGKVQTDILEALTDSPSQYSLEKVYWNGDVVQDKIGTQILNVMSEWSNLKELHLVDAIHSKSQRDQWRQTYKLKGKKVLLSQRELENLNAEDFDDSSVSEDEVDNETEETDDSTSVQ